MAPLRGSKKVLPNIPLDLPPALPQGEAVWKGPADDGISQTMLSHYIVCPERFRVMYVEGLQPIQTFEARMEFGNMWHLCEELHAAGKDYREAVKAHASGLCTKFPTQQAQVFHWYAVCLALFPIYMKYWSAHQDMVNRESMLEEEKFCVLYHAAGGQAVVKLRGKWDSVDLVTSGLNKGIWLQENKTKGGIEREKLTRQLRFDLQTMLYVVALQTDLGKHVKGVRYNVIKRSQHKTPESMLKKVMEDLEADRAVEWFARWNTELSSQDIEFFRRTSLDPILGNLADDYQWWAFCMAGKVSFYNSDTRHKQFPHHQRRHYITPYLGYNPLGEGGEGSVDNYIFTGSTVGMRRLTHADLFPELA